MNALASEEKTKRNLMTVFGIIAIVLGILAMMAPGLTGLSVAFLLGIIVLVSGIDRVIWAFQAGSFGRLYAGFVIGGLTVICGVVLILNPLFATGVLTALLALYFILDGIIEIVAGVRIRPLESWKWMLFGGIVSVVLGVLFWLQYPLAGAWAMGIMLGIKLLMIGLIMATGETTVAQKLEKEHIME